MRQKLLLIIVPFLLYSCGELSGKYKNSEVVYNINSDGTYEYIELELKLDGLSDNEAMLQDFDKLPREEKIKGKGKWTKKGNTLILDGPGLSNEYLIKNNQICTFDVLKNGEVCFEKL